MKKLLRDNEIFILAEVAQSYEGKVEVLTETLRKACDAGVDGIMFQVVFVDELAVPDYAHYKLFASLEMPDDAWKKAIDLIHEKKRLAVGEVFGKRSLDLVCALGIDAIKIHISDLANLPFLRLAGKKNIPVLLAIGGAQEDEIRTAIAALTESGAPEIVLLHGYQLGPTSVGDTHFHKIAHTIKKFNLPVGYSDHVAGCVDDKIANKNPLAVPFPLIALGEGARLIEKHIILDRTKAWEDYESALSGDEFPEFVNLIRSCAPALGAESFESIEPERAYKNRAIKALVAAKDLSKGTKITEEHLAFKRVSDITKRIYDTKLVVGRTLTADLKKDGIFSQEVMGN